MTPRLLSACLLLPGCIAALSLSVAVAQTDTGFDGYIRPGSDLRNDASRAKRLVSRVEMVPFFDDQAGGQPPPTTQEGHYTFPGTNGLVPPAAKWNPEQLPVDNYVIWHPSVKVAGHSHRYPDCLLLTLTDATDKLQREIFDSFTKGHYPIVEDSMNALDDLLAHLDPSQPLQKLTADGHRVRLLRQLIADTTEWCLADRQARITPATSKIRREWFRTLLGILCTKAAREADYGVGKTGDDLNGFVNFTESAYLVRRAGQQKSWLAGFAPDQDTLKQIFDAENAAPPAGQPAPPKAFQVWPDNTSVQDLLQEDVRLTLRLLVSFPALLARADKYATLAPPPNKPDEQARIAAIALIKQAVAPLAADSDIMDDTVLAIPMRSLYRFADALKEVSRLTALKAGAGH